MKKLKRITIKDVAAKCNTSVRTVSRVLNNDPHVKLETRKLVQETIDELGFKVNAIARSLKDKRTNQIVVFIDVHEGNFWGSFHNEILQELYKQTKANGYRMVISLSSADSFQDDDNDGFYLIRHGLCDGVIMFDTKAGDRRISFLKEFNVPFVIFGKDVTNYDTPYVDLDNEYAGYLGAKYLYENGYEDFVFFLGNEEFIVNQERARGFFKFCEEKGLTANTVKFGISSMEYAYRETREFLKTYSDKKLAIFISGDERAIGVYRAVHEIGLKVGEDIGVLGIDNIKAGEYFNPPLTTIDQPKKEFSETAFAILIEQLNQQTKVTKRILITPQIEKRLSL